MATSTEKKKKDKNIPVLFGIANADMHEAARNCRESFIEDKADFVAWDADFDDPYDADWLTLIEAAEAFPPDETIQDQLTEFTAAVELAMKNCRKKFQDSKYFIEKAYPDNKSMWHKFGFDDYNVAQRSQTRLIEFMNTFHAVASGVSAELIAVGYTAPKIAEILTLRTALLDANQVQETYDRSIPIATRDRRLANNEVWEVFQTVCQVGKRLYKDDWAKYQRYLLPPGEESAALISIKGTVKTLNGLTSQYEATQGVLVEVLSTGISRHTNSKGRYEIGALPDGNHVVRFTHPSHGPQEFNVVTTSGTPTVQDVNFG